LTRLQITTEHLTYNDSIVIQEYTQSRDTYGAIDAGSWATYKTVWAEIEDTQSNVSHESDMPVFEDGKSFKVHTHGAPSVTTKMRISYDSEFFYIRSIRKEGRLRTILVAEAYDDE